MDESDKIEYRVAGLNAGELRNEFARVFNETGGWELIRTRLPQGVDLAVVDKMPIRISEGRAGVDPATATIVVAAIGALAPIVQKVVLDLWNEVWLKRIKARKGKNAVGEPKKD